MTYRIVDIVDNRAENGLMAEFGLSLWVEAENRRILFDTGAGKAFLPNAAALGIHLENATDIVLSHGHNDHTAGVALLSPSVPIYAGAGIDAPCFSLHADGERHDLTMPAASRKILSQADLRIVDKFTEIAPGVFSTGSIPRVSGEDCGGQFFSDDACQCPHDIREEHALLLRRGALITGCCHAGIINTVTACRQAHPEIPIRIIIGGLHLLHSDENHLRRVADFLNATHVEKLVLLHCTGDAAVQFLQKHFSGEVVSGAAGCIYEW